MVVAGRQTGSEGWRAARGELGAAPSVSSSTAFQLAGDDCVKDTHPGRLCGGVVRASGQHHPHQTAVRVRLLCVSRQQQSVVTILETEYIDDCVDMTVIIQSNESAVRLTLSQPHAATASLRGAVPAVCTELVWKVGAMLWRS